ncbi:SOUL family heme-binding protein [Mycolicibacterium sediminis]|uniref:SOUL family heme-binding protein n=1 Tax=Mycolicibacterium sediminis TaxID=1286180 RepID=UPI0013D5F363|nr:heme-binding protein [Mycolicibacterium sediminis]
MIGRVASLVGQVGESLLSIVGIRNGTEEPRHNSEPLGDGVELREYGTRIAAETTVTAVEADEEGARSEGFRRLAGYIFGKNTTSGDIAMTAPVVQSREGKKIAMTAPVAQSAQDVEVGTGWVIRFFMPSKWTLETLPKPVDERVRLVEVPGETFAVLRFSGDRGPDAVAKKTAELLDVVKAYGFEPSGEPAAWFYDPPWTLPPLRRNEIAVPVAV